MVIAHADHDPEQPSYGSTQVGYQIDRSDSHSGVVTMEMNVSSDKDDSKNAPYEYDVRAFAMLAYLDDTTDPLDDNDLKRAGVVGYQAAIGAIREHIASMTARGPWDTFFLRIVDIDEDEIGESQGS